MWVQVGMANGQGKSMLDRLGLGQVRGFWAENRLILNQLYSTVLYTPLYPSIQKAHKSH